MPGRGTSTTAAASAPVRLRRSSPEEPGIRRRRRGRGFSYTGPDDAPVTDAITLERVAALAVPPAWTEVWICANENGHLQATGVDADGRTQYRYHERWTAGAHRRKFARVRQLSAVTAPLRARITRDLRSPDAHRRAIAIALRLIDAVGMRVGEERYARERGTVGALTLERRHVRVSGSTVRLDFPAKSGVAWRGTLDDADLAAAIRTAPGSAPNARITAWEDEETGELRTVRPAALTGYLREATGLPVTPKDLRTLIGSRIAAQSLARAGTSRDSRERERRIREAVGEVAEALHNTVAVARSSYIDPLVLERYRRGRVARLVRGGVSDAELARLIGSEG